jgi:hypothetical protein
MRTVSGVSSVDLPSGYVFLMYIDETRLVARLLLWSISMVSEPAEHTKQPTWHISSCTIKVMDSWYTESQIYCNKQLGRRTLLRKILNSRPPFQFQVKKYKLHQKSTCRVKNFEFDHILSVTRIMLTVHSDY